MGRTDIQWTDMVWNPTTGCSKVSQGCKNCYALRLFPKVYPKREFTDVRTHEDRLEAPLHWKKPRRIFVNSMSDLFHESIPDQFIGRCFGVMAQAYWHTFQVLTKRPLRMLEWSKGLAHYWRGDRRTRPIIGWPPNVWVGVSIEDQPTADERIPLLIQTPATVRFISYEPALAGINVARYLAAGFQEDRRLIHWVIAGGESGPKARPSHPDWFRQVRNQCQAAGVAFFMKQLGGWPDKRGELEDIPEDLRVREYPKVK